MMGKIFRWIGYASTLVGAILIIWACIGIGCHHCYAHAAKTDTVCCKHQLGATAVTKTDSVACKHNSAPSTAAMADSAKCNHKPCCAAAAKADAGCCKYNESCANGCHRHHPENLFSAAISFLLLAIALFMISKHCCCKKCCDDNEGKCETKEEKNQA